MKREIRYDRDALDCIPLKSVSQMVRDAEPEPEPERLDARRWLDAPADDRRPFNFEQYMFELAEERRNDERRAAIAKIAERLRGPVLARQLDDGFIYFQFRGKTNA